LNQESGVQKGITVGIPAYNEEQNILNLLQSLEEQQHARGLAISQVIVSDDSSDGTPSLVEKFALRSPLDIKIVHHRARRGAAAAWNEIFQLAAGDVIVLYDADTVPHPCCTEELASRIRGDAVLCASNSQPVQATGAAGRASIFLSNWLRSARLAEDLSQYTVMGRALAIDSRAASRIEIPSEIIAIDLYLQCRVLEMGLNVVYNDNAIIYFKPAGSMQDLASQVVRAVNGHSQLRDYISRLDIGLPAQAAIAEAAKNAAKDPLGAASAAIGYSLMPYYMSRLKNANSAKWHTAETSKSIDYQQLKTRF
jgi:glycosyltransferase involved in cell wall biosynthesis